MILYNISSVWFLLGLGMNIDKTEIYQLKEILNSLYGYATNLYNMEYLTIQDEPIKGLMHLANRLEKVIGGISVTSDKRRKIERRNLFYFDVLYLGKGSKLEINPPHSNYRLDYLSIEQVDKLNELLKNNYYQIVLIEQSVVSKIDIAKLNSKNTCFLSVYLNEHSISKHQIFTEYLTFESVKYDFDDLIDRGWKAFTQSFFINKLKSKRTLSILSIEDDYDSQQSLRELLEIYNLTITVCSSANQAVTLVTSKQYDITILDIGLKDVTGYELALKIRQIQKDLNHFLCPILVNSGKRNMRKKDYKFYGITKYYEKPYLVKNVYNILAEYLPMEFL